MLKKWNDILAGTPMTMVGAVFLVLSFVLPRAGVALPVDPAWATVVICGYPLLYLALWRVVHNPGISKISSALLIVIAMAAAVMIGDLFAAGEVGFIMELGAILEDRTTEGAKKGLKQLISLAPAQGRRVAEGGEEMIPAEEIRQGDILRILPGEKIPVDGVIVKGETSVDQSIMTGESLPVDKGQGEELFCGTVNCFGSVDMRATKVGEDSSLQKLIRMVQEAEQRQAPMQRIADRCASWLVPVALLIAVAAGLVTGDIVRAVTVLVVFCPCALVLATPTAIMAAIGQATKHGVIIKSGEALEKMGRVDTVAFDKTGTLTFGRLQVSDVRVFEEGVAEHELLSLDPKSLAGDQKAVRLAQPDQLSMGLKNPTEDLEAAGLAETALLSLAASAEAKSEHPLARAIVAYAGERGISLEEAESFQMEAGKGVVATVRGRQLFCGNETFLREKGADIGQEAQSCLETIRAQGKAAVLVAEGGSCIGVLALSDELRPEASDMVGRLAHLHTKAMLLTGDHQRAAAYFADQAGITEVCAGLLPGEKAETVRTFQEQGHVVCMIGDGVNDAPALKTADVGVAMGSMGSDIAVEAADIALMGDDISKIPYLKRLSNATVKTIKCSIALSMAINFVAVACSALGLLTPTTGALVHNAGSCLVVLIAALLYDRKFL